MKVFHKKKLLYTHHLIKLFIAAMAYYITPLMIRGLSVTCVDQTISELKTFFVYTLTLTMPIFDKKSHLIRPVEGLKLCFDFYVIKTVHKKSRQSLRPSTGRIRRDFFFQN